MSCPLSAFSHNLLLASQKKLRSEEYRDIDERHRVVVIKYETTQIAVADLDKYYSARKFYSIVDQGSLSCTGGVLVFRWRC